jgi:hypothetical protein
LYIVVAKLIEIFLIDSEKLNECGSVIFFTTGNKPCLYYHILTPGLYSILHKKLENVSSFSAFFDF